MLGPLAPMLCYAGDMLGHVGLCGAHVGICWGSVGHAGAHVGAMLAHVGAFLAYVGALFGLCWPRLRVILALVGAILPFLQENGVLSKNGVSPRQERHFGFA